MKKYKLNDKERIEAVQWNGTNISKCVEFCKYCYYSNGFLYLIDKIIKPSDYIVKLGNNEFIIISKKAFNKLFVEDNDNNKSDAEVGV